MDEGRLGRREFFLAGGSLMLGALSGGVVAAAPATAGVLRDAGAKSSSHEISSGRRVAGFGWEVTNLHNNGADVFFRVMHTMQIHFIDVDVSYMITSLPAGPGFAEVLYTGSIQGKEAFSSGPQGYIESPLSSDFSAVQMYNPNHLNAVMDGALYQGSFMRLILKSWVPSDGSASQQYRHVRAEPELVAQRGAVLVFHMDHAGVAVDSEMQVVLGYSLL